MGLEVYGRSFGSRLGATKRIRSHFDPQILGIHLEPHSPTAFPKTHVPSKPLEENYDAAHFAPAIERACLKGRLRLLVAV